MADDGRQGEAAADDASCAVSPDLAGPGRIVERATTWWDLWRRPEEYLVERGSGAVFREGAGSVLREGHGLLLRAPEAIAAMAARVAQDPGAVPLFAFSRRAGG